MPVYDYRCTACSAQQEEVHSIHVDPEIPCKACGEKTARIIGRTNFVLHGDVWAKDGYKTIDIKK